MMEKRDARLTTLRGCIPSQLIAIVLSFLDSRDAHRNDTRPITHAKSVASPGGQPRRPRVSIDL